MPDINTPLLLPVAELPDDPGWLCQQPRVVIGYGAEEGFSAADVLVPDEAGANKLVQRIARYPLAALVLVQVLRDTESLCAPQALDIESLAYSTLQSGPEFRHWRDGFPAEPVASGGEEGEAIILQRQGDAIEAVLNRPATRNAITVEMRDALVELLQLLTLDDSIRTLSLAAKGACFSAGGELREFGQAPDPATAHWVRTRHSPARLLAQHRDKVTCYVHGACIGSGIELPAFAHRLVAHRKTFFHLPELELGLIPGAGGTYSIARRIGRQRTALMVLGGRRVNAATALSWGLVDELQD